MATIASPRPHQSPTLSQTSLHSSQDASQDGKSALPSAAVATAADNVTSSSRRPSAVAANQHDGHLAPPPQATAHSDLNGDHLAASPPEQSKKQTLSTRLTRMFSSRGESPGSSKEPPKNRDRASSAASSSAADDSHYQSDADVTSDRPSTKRSSSSAVPLKPVPNGTLERNSPVSHVQKSEAKEECSLKKTRYIVHEDGTHEHNLKSDKRQEKLSSMFKNMFSKKPEGVVPEDHQLSLMSNWVDQIKSEKVAGDQKGGPNCAHTLVEKYGKCNEVVGRGAFGIVRISHKADDKDPKKEQLYAVKEFRRRPSESPKKYNKRLTSEFCISSALRHPNVIHTLDLMKDSKGDFCEVMEYCAGGDLYTLVLTAVKLEVLEADCYFKQLMRGVEYIHEMGVAHRDLKPENLLLTTRGALKITDFGNGECFRMAWEKEAHMVAGLCGSAPYIAPEEYVDNEFDPRAVDVWACGVIYMAMRTGRHLWRVARKDEDEFYERYLEGRRDEDGYGPIETLHRARCRNVIYSILDPNPSRRITASQVLKSEWGRDIKLCKAGEEGY